MMTNKTDRVALLGFLASDVADQFDEEHDLNFVKTPDPAIKAIVAPDIDPENTVDGLTEAHERLVRLAREATIIPVRVGTMVPGGEITAEMERVRRLLSRVDGCVEARVRGSYDEDGLFDALASNLPKLSGKDLSRDQKIELGRRIANLVEGERERDTGRVLSAIGSLIRDSQRRPVVDLGLCDLSVLIPRDLLSDLDDALRNLVENEVPYARFKVLAPLPAYSFVETP